MLESVEHELEKPVRLRESFSEGYVARKSNGKVKGGIVKKKNKKSPYFWLFKEPKKGKDEQLENDLFKLQ